VGFVGVVTAPVAPGIALAALTMWMIGAFYRGRAVTTPLVHQLRLVASSALLPLASLAVGVGVLGIAPAALPHAIVAVSGAAAVTAVSRSLRWNLQAPVRVLAVGDRASVASAITQLPRTSNSRVVSAVVIEDALAREDVPHHILGVTTHADIEGVAEIVDRQGVDLVVVDPGRGVSEEDFRALTWALEERRVAIGVSGVLRSIAPHRLVAGKLGRPSILDVRPPRQSRYVRALKSLLDRALAGLALLLLSPVLCGLMIAVRVDSPGSALFTQTRVGRHGHLFKVYKLRTMDANAEARKAELSRDNEFDSVLFKVRQDPRVTRLGAFLRKLSLDELPQLINVLRGEMSLVGPRPHLPEEVDLMDEATRRRHAVTPGITGLWQVSGRSDLSWGDTSDLDTYYADNWSLSSDAAILARTVRAVVGGKGAY